VGIAVQNRSLGEEVGPYRSLRAIASALPVIALIQKTINSDQFSKAQSLILAIHLF